MMDSGTAIKLFDFVLIFGSVLAWCFWQLWDHHKWKKRREAGKRGDGGAPSA